MTNSLASLRRLVRRPPREERCELCAARLPESHDHLVDCKERRILCACQACAILFDGRVQTPYRRVPRDITYFPEFRLSDAAWNALAIPIGLAFVFRSSSPDRTVALYPSPAGPAESVLDDLAWSDIVQENAALAQLRPDVEALLINRVNGAREYYVAPIDECYRLTGIIRTSWRGFSGGADAERQIAAFFESLRRRARSIHTEAYAG